MLAAEAYPDMADVESIQSQPKVASQLALAGTSVAGQVVGLRLIPVRAPLVADAIGRCQVMNEGNRPRGEPGKWMHRSVLGLHRLVCECSPVH